MAPPSTWRCSAWSTGPGPCPRRRGEPHLRQQIALLAAAALVALLAPPLSLAGVDADWLFAVSLLPLLVAVGFAVLVRGQYDLSTAANRTLVWVILSAAVIAIYALVIAGVGSLLDVRDAQWLPWVAAAAVALSLPPLRDALQRGVNPLIFGRWDDPYQVLAGLGQRLAAAADVDRLLAGVAAELHDGLALDHVGIRDDAGRLLAGDDGDRPAEVTIMLTAFHRPAGTLHYRATAPLRAEDRRLIDDVARQLGGCCTPAASTGRCNEPARTWCSPARRSAAGCAATCTTVSVRRWPAMWFGWTSPSAGSRPTTPPAPNWPPSGPRCSPPSAICAGWWRACGHRPWTSSGWPAPCARRCPG